MMLRPPTHESGVADVLAHMRRTKISFVDLVVIGGEDLRPLSKVQGKAHAVMKCWELMARRGVTYADLERVPGFAGPSQETQPNQARLIGWTPYFTGAGPSLDIALTKEAFQRAGLDCPIKTGGYETSSQTGKPNEINGSTNSKIGEPEAKSVEKGEGGR